MPDDNHIAQASGNHVLAGRGHGARVGVIADKLRPLFRLARSFTLQGLANQVLPEFVVVLVPAHETKPLALQARRAVSQHQGCLNQKGSAAAHRVKQDRLFLNMIQPAGKTHQGSGQGFFQGRFAGSYAIAAPVQALTREIKGQACARALHMQIQSDIRAQGVDIGPFAKAAAELVGNRVFHPQGGKLGMGNGRIDQGAVHGKGLFNAQMLIPHDLAGMLVDGIRVGRVKTGQFQENARGKARPQTGAVAAFQGAAAPTHRSGLGADVLAAAGCNFFADQSFQTGGAGGGEEQGLTFTGTGLRVLDWRHDRWGKRCIRAAILAVYCRGVKLFSTRLVGFGAFLRDDSW